MNERIDHAAEAIAMLENYAPDYTVAQVHATLALVEQQRVANLIAYDRSRIHFPGFRGLDATVGIEMEIRESLGLT